MPDFLKPAGVFFHLIQEPFDSRESWYYSSRHLSSPYPFQTAMQSGNLVLSSIDLALPMMDRQLIRSRFHPLAAYFLLVLFDDLLTPRDLAAKVLIPPSRLEYSSLRPWTRVLPAIWFERRYDTSRPAP